MNAAETPLQRGAVIAEGNITAIFHGLFQPLG